MKFKVAVTNIVDTPKYYRFGNVEWWQMIVEYELMDEKFTTTLRYQTREEVEKIKVGSKIVV